MLFPWCALEDQLSFTKVNGVALAAVVALVVATVMAAGAGDGALVVATLMEVAKARR